MGLILVVGTPDGAEQCAVSYDFARVERQIFQHFVFGGGEMHIGAVYCDLALGEIYYQAVRPEARLDANGARTLGGMTQGDTDAGDELSHAEGLGEVIVCASL